MLNRLTSSCYYSSRHHRSADRTCAGAFAFGPSSGNEVSSRGQFFMHDPCAGDDGDIVAHPKMNGSPTACDTFRDARACPTSDGLPGVVGAFGGFSYLAATDRWEWSDAVARMHGYEPGTMTPTTELILSHKHDEDRVAVGEIIEQVLRGDAPFSSRHRIRDTAGHVHHVVVVGEHLRDDDDHVIGTTGFYIDITAVIDTEMQHTVTEAVTAIEAQRAVINQAIGVIMWTYGVSAERAFDVLTWRSQHTNTKVRRIAAQFLADLTAGAPRDNNVDRLLLTAHIPAATPHDQRSPQNDGLHLPDALPSGPLTTENEPLADTSG